MSCNTCEDNERQCDGNGPVCGPCAQNGEIFCKWTTIAAVDDQTSANAMWPPPGLENSESARAFWADNTCKRLFDLDEEIRSLILRTSREAVFGQVEAANAILGIALAIRNSRYQSRAIEDYQQSAELFYQGLRNGLHGAQRRFAGITVSLLNIFERCVIPSEVKRYTHLTGMRLVVQGSPICGTEPSAMPCAVVKSLIYHTAVGGIFAFPDAVDGLPTTYIHDLRSRLPRSSGHQCKRLDSVHGVPLSLLQLIYEISFIRFRISTTSLSNQDILTLGRIKDTLEQRAFIDSQLRPNHGFRITELYRRTCILLVEKILSPSMTCMEARTLTLSCLEVFQSISVETATPSIVWPLLVLFFAALPDERNRILQYLSQLQLYATEGKLQAFLAHLRQIATDQKDAGDDALFNMLLATEIGSLRTITLL